MVQTVLQLKQQENTNPQASPLPATGLVKLKTLLGNSKTNPPILPIIPVSRTTWHNGVKSGKYPKPIKLGEHSIAWRVEDIRALLEELGA